MGETVRWAQNCLRIFELRKSVNGKESIPAQSTCHMASATEGGGREKSKHFQVPRGHKPKWQAAANPFLQILKNTESKTARKYAKLSANQRASIWIRESRKKRHAEKMREQSMQQALRILTEVNYYQPSFNPLRKKWEKRCVGPKTAREYLN